MLKVFLVEDEIVVREGIKNNINWQEHGFHFCGEASDGELAYPMIQKTKPDVVLTDIRMPFMDGLELSRLIKRDMPWVKIIILSGYGEFEYAKEAINIGVTEYLLKPISSAELIKSMKSVKDNLLKEQEEKANLEKFQRDMKEYEVEERRRLFQDMVGGNLSLANILERGNDLNLELSALSYNIVLFKMNGPKQSGYEAASFTEAAQELEVLLESKKNVIKFDCFIEGIALLFKGSSIEETLKIQEHYINEIKKIMNSKKNLSYFGGIGMPVRRLGELPNSFQEASRAFAYRYILDISEILDSAAISGDRIAIAQPAGLDMGNVIQLDKKKVEGFLKSGNKEDISYFVEEYLKSIGNANRNSLLFRQYMVMDMYYIVAGFSEELGYGTEVIEEPFQDISQMTMQISSFEFTKRYIEKIFNQAVDLREESSSKHLNDITNKAKIFINENYQKDELSLNLVANSVYISPNHFSAVFSQKTGNTFIKYLTDLRMSKAKELLKCTDMRTSDIGYAIGYKDPHYFSYLFKKTQKCTPKQYRSNSRGGTFGSGIEEV
jgi:two-component system response regulator YesN